MHYYTISVFLILLIILLLTFFVLKKRNSRRLILASAWILFIPLFIPRQWWGEWDSIEMLKGKKINKILLSPSTPDWEVNLTDSLLVIDDTGKIDKILDYLRKTEVYFPGHPMRIWETNLIFITSANDSILYQIRKTQNNGAVIYSPDSRWRKDEIGQYLERIVNFSKPLRAKKS
jgi:hypothetical protein